jgi:hypothetical protein
VTRALFVAALLSISSFSSAAQRVPWTLDDSYTGSHRDSYQRLKYEIPILMRQTLINIAIRTGLNFQDGWDFPLTVRFVDDAPWGAENVLAYVQMASGEKGPVQTLNICLTAYDRDHFDFEKVFAHELTHAMLNDAVGTQATQVLPVWLHEGLAVFAADQGESVVKSYVYNTDPFSESRMLNGLDGPHGALDYAEDYLAIKYINVRHGSNGLHNFIRDIVDKKGDVNAAMEYSLRESWDEFQKNAREFAKGEIKAVGPVKRGGYEKPY